MSDERLRAFCEGLEMQDVDTLMTRTAGDFRRVGEVMAGRIKDLATREAELVAEVERLREAGRTALAYLEGCEGLAVAIPIGMLRAALSTHPEQESSS